MIVTQLLTTSLFVLIVVALPKNLLGIRNVQLSAARSREAGIAHLSAKARRPETNHTNGLPDNDEWYKPPANLTAVPPGTILKYRPLPRGLSLNNKDAVYPKNAWQIQYRTTSSNGNAEATIVTLFEPFNADPSRLFSYSWIQNAAFEDCAPSVGMQVGTRADNYWLQQQVAIIVSALSQGWYVSVTDDAGLSSSFGKSPSNLIQAVEDQETNVTTGNGMFQGRAALDSLRAVKSSSNFTGLSQDPRMVSLGYSGGSFASGWAAELQPAYAPDIHLRGVAVGGLVANVTESFFVNKEHASDSLVYQIPALLGIAKQFPDMASWLAASLLPERAAEFGLANSQCLDSNSKLYANKSIGYYLKDNLQSLQGAVPRMYIDRVASLGNQGTPEVPIYAFATVGDTVTPISLMDRLFKKYCENGANIIFERNPDAKLNHETEVRQGLPGAMRWLADRLNHDDFDSTSGCQTYTETPHSRRASSQGMWLRGLAAVIFAQGGQPIGPGSWTSFITKFSV